MRAIFDSLSFCVDRARESEDGSYAQQIVRTGPLEHRIVALTEGSRLLEHEVDVHATLYILFGAVQVMAEEPFVLESGALHEMPTQRRTVVALQDTAMMLTAVRLDSEESANEHPLT